MPSRNEQRGKYKKEECQRMCDKSKGEAIRLPRMSGIDGGNVQLKTGRRL